MHVEIQAYRQDNDELFECILGSSEIESTLRPLLRNASAGEYKTLWIKNLSASQAGWIFLLVDAFDLDIAEITCNSSNLDFFFHGYFHTHVPEEFCENFAVEFNGWHWVAFSNLIVTFHESAKANDVGTPLFDIGIYKEENTDGFVTDLNQVVGEKRDQENFVPPDFGKPPRWAVVHVD